MKITKIGLMTCALTFVGMQAQAGLIKIDNQHSIDSNDLVASVSYRGANFGPGQHPVGDDNPHTGRYTFWPHGNAMNKNLTMTYANPIKNRAGKDGAIFMYRPSIIWGGTIGVTINGVYKDIFADNLIGHGISTAHQRRGVFAGLFDLSDFGLSVGESINSIQISASRKTFGAYNGRLINVEIGNGSDVQFAGAGGLHYVDPVNPVPVPGSIALLGLGLGLSVMGMKKRKKKA
ncbi:PEP-CTERM sorting domain-containing protein [Spartinivicinus poritis]|uniref:PEP-CTERM sorting domain-containing protein n=1 Tax=Spartinivicinus poritis TaxID=2994640 RepID=A0ABT5U633_9GAMM|nr:PEP-CTERM sorting domain-containing protein [Spartinivicinus sp. A2-2]MDE1461431.1 PEP-CTERM sorting domain-containing protein [Spartinivicinus sp. A2-2]